MYEVVFREYKIVDGRLVSFTRLKVDDQKVTKEERLQRRRDKYSNNIKTEREKGRARDQIRRTKKKLLPVELSEIECVELLKGLTECSLSGAKEDLHLDHFIPLSWGHGGTYIGNMIPLSSELNLSKNNRNPFEWIKGRSDSEKIKFNQVVSKLSELNGLTSKEYKEFVYWCSRNKRTIEQIKLDGDKTSLELWKESLKHIDLLAV